ncbi:hypothetical protein OH799_16505 [Nocardia sp. NBC_00881]|uniref:hypothetical protein n=1 Tax=Nocardia sp. NBC_00881 TaxID=2975995 RepID=UPI00386B0758|nr:hypothetical protein OH799_16505 [Nocardia sp. NBC_00881]
MSEQPVAGTPEPIEAQKRLEVVLTGLDPANELSEVKAYRELLSCSLSDSKRAIDDVIHGAQVSVGSFDSDEALNVATQLRDAGVIVDLQ